MSFLLDKAEIQTYVEKIDVGPSFSLKCLLFLITTVPGITDAGNSLRVNELENTSLTGNKYVSVLKYLNADLVKITMLVCLLVEVDMFSAFPRDELANKITLNFDSKGLFRRHDFVSLTKSYMILSCMISLFRRHYNVMCDFFQK